jgi:hypothetical protein
MVDLGFEYYSFGRPTGVLTPHFVSPEVASTSAANASAQIACSPGG